MQAPREPDPRPVWPIVHSNSGECTPDCHDGPMATDINAEDKTKDTVIATKARWISDTVLTDLESYILGKWKRKTNNYAS